jgi:hypothetical protein
MAVRLLMLGGSATIAAARLQTAGRRCLDQASIAHVEPERNPGRAAVLAFEGRMLDVRRGVVKEETLTGWRQQRHDV